MDDRHAPRPYQIGRPHFGYGSNMWPPWLWFDAKSARAWPNPARLPDHRLEFSKLSTLDDSAKSNVAERRGREVWGVLFDIDERELRALNEKEGGYTPTDITVYHESGNATPAWTYVWRGPRSKRTKKWPYQWYVDLMNKGAAHFGLPKPYRDSLRRRGKRSPKDPGRTDLSRMQFQRALDAACALAGDPDAPPQRPPPA